MKILENLKTASIGKRVPISKRIDYTVSFDKPVPFEDAFYVRSEIVIGMNQIVRDNREIPYAHKNAQAALTREIYGEVIEKLLDIREKLWENRPLYDDKVLEMVESLLKEFQS